MDGKQFTNAISPIFKTAEPNSDIELFRGEVQLTQDELFILGLGNIKVQWLPSPKILLHLDVTTQDHFGLSFDKDVQVSVLELNLQTPAILVAQTDSHVAAVLRVCEFGTGNKIDKLHFHLANFLNFTGSPITDSGRNIRSDGLEFKTKHWFIKIHKVNDYQEIYNQLRNTGGYAISHVGEISKNSDETFDVGEAKVALERLFFFLSFLNGCWSPPILISAYEANAKVWESWSLNRSISEWNGAANWFPQLAMSEPELQPLAETFFDYFGDVQGEVLSSAISWYVQSRAPSTVETKLLLSQIGLELLAWAEFVELTERVSKDGFKRLKLDDRLNLLLSELKISLEIPEKLKNLRKICKKNNWSTGAVAIMELRNSIVHPNLRARMKNADDYAKSEARFLSVWYLELALLKFLNYNGEYHNIFSSSNTLQSEPVPWSNAKPRLKMPKIGSVGNVKADSGK